jgi:aspartate ammonia-lyase
MTDRRADQDPLGMREVPGDALYGIDAVRSAENFPFPGRPIARVKIRIRGGVKSPRARLNDGLHAVSSACVRHDPESQDRIKRFGS